MDQSTCIHKTWSLRSEHCLRAIPCVHQELFIKPKCTRYLCNRKSSTAEELFMVVIKSFSASNISPSLEHFFLSICGIVIILRVTDIPKGVYTKNSIFTTKWYYWFYNGQRATFFRGDRSWNVFYGHSPLARIQEGQLTVSGDSMCTSTG